MVVAFVYPLLILLLRFREIVLDEQSEYIKFATEMLTTNRPFVDIQMSPDAKRYAQEKMNSELARVRALPRLFYPASNKDHGFMRMIPSVSEQETVLTQYEMRMQTTLLELVSKY